MPLSRRELMGYGAAAAIAVPATAQQFVDLGLPGGPSARAMRPRFPQKGAMIVQRVRPPLLETPFAVFDGDVLTPNEFHYVRWHWPFPTEIDVAAYRLAVRGAVNKPLSLSLANVLASGETVSYAAVNQCAGNGRGLFTPRVPGAQWANGAMSNAKWRGVRLSDVLDEAGLRGDAKYVRFTGLDTPLIEGAPAFAKSIPIDVARRPDTIIAYAMNDAPLPLLNGFPVRLIVPGWFSTYWVKMLADIEVITSEDDGFFMAKSYRWPTVPVKPGDKDYPTAPITAMPPRSFVTSHRDGDAVKRGTPLDLRGVAFGGDQAVASVVVTLNGQSRPAELTPDDTRYGFRRWQLRTAAIDRDTDISVKCTNTAGIGQPDAPIWNPSGYALNSVERIRLVAA